MSKKKARKSDPQISQKVADSKEKKPSLRRSVTTADETSRADLKNVRQFYLVFPGRTLILYPSGRETGNDSKRHPSGSEFQQSFSPQLSWSPYRALMRGEVQTV